MPNAVATPALMLNLTSVVLANPFMYTFVLASLYAVITKLGYSQVAELIYSALQFTLLRSANRDFIKCWRDLRAAKLEVSKVSAQDEFAKWAKLQRAVDALQADFDKKSSSRQKSMLAVQFVGSVVLRVICYIGVVFFLYTHAHQHAMAYDLFLPEFERFPLAVSALSFPSAPEGTVSVAVWALICNIAAKEALNAFIA